MKRALLIGVAASALACSDAQKSSWGLEAIDTMTTPPDDPKLMDPKQSCGVQLPDESELLRQSCTFGSGDMPSKTVGVSKALAAQIPIRHVIVMMKENRSFDHLLGQLHALNPKVEAVPDTYVNPDKNGDPVSRSHATTTCIPIDPGHQSKAMATGINGGKMDGFVISAADTTGTDGHDVMQYYDQTDLPFYYFLASTYALNERHFAPAASGTYANRNFLMFGTNAGAVDTGIVYPDPATPSLLHLLMNAGLTWGAYVSDEPFEGSLDMRATDPGVHPLQDLYDALDNGTLPSVAFVDGKEDVDDDHPTADLQDGELWVHQLYDHAIKSPQWERLAILWTWDEGGGFPDHVAPGVGCRPEAGSPFTQRGVRVGMIVISPWARHGFVSDVAQDHTAITRFIETVFSLPALTARDANSPAMLDMFDFTCGRDLSIPDAPDAGIGGCPVQPPMLP
jgi:phospholipase C